MFSFFDGLALLFIWARWTGVHDYSWWWLVPILLMAGGSTIKVKSVKD